MQGTHIHLDRPLTDRVFYVESPRDRRPVFVMPWRDGFAFASEIKQLRLFPDCQLTPNFEHLDRFASTGRPYSGSEHTFFENVSQVEPGTALLISESGSRTLTYFSLRSMMDVHSKSSVDELVDAAASALARSVEIRLRADVPVGVCLSSGIDSTAIVRTMAAFGSMTNRLAVTFDASVSTRSEAPIAKRTASHVGLSWARVQGSRDEYDSIRTRLLWHHETPIPDSSLYAQWSVFQEARRRGIVVMLDGQGADELFGGYLKLLVSHTKQSLARNPLHGLVALSGLIRHLLAAPPRRSTFARFSPFQHVRGPGNSSGNPRNPPMENEAHMRLADLTTWSLPNLLAWEDRNSMAHSLEARLPFLDPELLAIGLSAQPEFLYHKGWTKFPLRSVVSGLGEPEIAWRRAKLQFESPEIGWMAERAKTDTRLLSPYWSSAQLGPATQDLKRLAAAGHLSAFKKLRAIDDFLVLFWPS